MLAFDPAWGVVRAGIGLGKGGYWEDHVNYDWYAGI